MHIIRIILVSIIAVIMVIFSISNRDAVTIKFFPFDSEVSLPLFVVVLLSVAVGALFAWLKCFITVLCLQKDCRRQEKRIKDLESEMAAPEVED